jgi:fructokinase
VTDGGRAVHVVVRGGATELPVPSVEVVDTVGAGDAFGGAFLSSWIERGLGRGELADTDRLQPSVEFAIRVASETCRRAGAEPPTAAEMADAN